MKKKIIFTLLLLYSSFVSSIKCNTVDTSALLFNCKLLIINDYGEKGTSLKSINDISDKLQCINQSFKISFLASKGFVDFDTSFFFISFTSSDSSKVSLSPNSECSNLGCEFVICGYVKNNYFILYKLKGFYQNDFKLFFNSLPSRLPYSRRELLNNYFFVSKFNIDKIDLNCLHEAAFDRKRTQLYPCMISCKKRNIEMQIMYSFSSNKNKNKYFKNRQRLWYGYFVP